MGYFGDTLKGVSWVGLLRGSTRLITFVRIAILARLLLPEQFGVFGIAVLVITFLEIITETGINIFFIQGEGKLRDYLNTAWIVSILRGLLVGVVIYLSSSLIATFFNSPEAVTLLKLSSLIPIVRGFINPAIVKLQKDLQFGKYFLFNFSTFTFQAIVAIALAAITRDAVSLIWGMIAGALLEVMLSLVAIKPLPKLQFDFNKFKKIISRGKWVTMSGLFNYLFSQGDDAVVGKVLNTNALGIYQMAYKVSSLPITEVVDVFGRVTLPVYAKIVDDKIRLRRAFFKTLMTVSALVIPAGVVIYVFAYEVVLILLGPNWLEAVAVLKVLAAFGVIHGILRFPEALLFSLKKQEYVTAVTFVSIVGLGLSIFPLIGRFGVVGAGYAAVIGSIASFPLVVFYLYKIFK